MTRVAHDQIPRGEVLPSVMSADFLRLGEQIDALLSAGAQIFHVDVMDAHFVPNLTLGPGFTAALADPVRAAGGLVDVHLMVERPGQMVDAFAGCSDAISVHLEADPHPARLLEQIRDHGCLAGIALNPGTPVEAVAPLAALADYVNVMAVSPGYAGQSFRPETPARVSRVRALLPEVVIQVDGGVGLETLSSVRDAGADWFVSASAIFGAPDPVAAVAGLRSAAGGV